MLVLTQEESTSHTNMHYISDKNHIVTPFKTDIYYYYFLITLQLTKRLNIVHEQIHNHEFKNKPAGNGI
jgi:hypothetical protein